MNRIITGLVLWLAIMGSACSVPNSHRQSGQPLPADDLFQLSVDAQRAYQESRWTDAARLYQQIVERVPVDAAAWFRLANTYARQGAYEQAIHAYEQSLKHNTDQPKAWFNLSSTYLLHAKSAMQQSHRLMQRRDPGKPIIEQRLKVLDELVHGAL